MASHNQMVGWPPATDKPSLLSRPHPKTTAWCWSAAFPGDKEMPRTPGGLFPGGSTTPLLCGVARGIRPQGTSCRPPDAVLLTPWQDAGSGCYPGTAQRPRSSPLLRSQHSRDHLADNRHQDKHEEAQCGRFGQVKVAEADQIGRKVQNLSGSTGATLRHH